VGDGGLREQKEAHREFWKEWLGMIDAATMVRGVLITALPRW
jgi:hypothetical protein